MSTQLELLITELQKMAPTERVFFWTGWDKEPYSDEQFRQYLTPCKELLAILTNQPLPAPTTIRVKTTAALNVRRAPATDGERVATLAIGVVITVYETQERTGWYKIVDGTYAGMYVSAQYVVKA
jgi:SH3 domain-containing protein